MMLQHFQQLSIKNRTQTFKQGMMPEEYHGFITFRMDIRILEAAVPSDAELHKLQSFSLVNDFSAVDLTESLSPGYRADPAMTEAAGLVLGVVGLFSANVQAFDMVQIA